MDPKVTHRLHRMCPTRTIVRHPRNHGFMVAHVLNGMRQDTLCETPNLRESDGKYLL